MIRKGFPSTPLIANALSPPAFVSVRMIVLSIPAPWMVMAFILAPCPVFHALRPDRRAGGKLHGVAVLGRVDRLPDGLRGQGGSSAGLGMSGFEQ